ncbi:MAG: hypothetical protein OXI17_06390 [Gammaproteobacteria bacterium]|nr:hypothetical protein [Gammaproteobacteria bacterium]MXY90453.1 hypothetical protein [Gammaproteobacteria bacterium]MYC59696.1 hypothetical protein [Gammaproteobacteria bacterium]
MKDSKRSRRNKYQRTRDSDPHVTSSEHHLNLIDRDMETRTTIAHIMRGLDDIAKGRFSRYSILDIAEEN